MRGILFLMVAALAAPAVAQQPKRVCTTAAYTDAAMEESLQVCAEILADKRQPVAEHVQSYSNRAAILRMKKDFDGAIRDLDRAIALVAKAKISRGFLTKPPAGAVDATSAAGVYQMRGRAYAEKGQHSRAIEDFSKALQISRFHSTFMERAESYAAMGENDRALADLDQALAMASDYGGIYEQRGALLLKMAQPERALRDFDRALQLVPKSTRALNGRALAHMAKGALDAAMRDLDAAIAIHPGPDAFNSRGLLWQKRGDLDRAIADFEQAISQRRSYSGPPLADLHSNRGDAYAGRGDWLRALEDYQSALATSSSHPRASAGRDQAREALARPVPPPAPPPTAVVSPAPAPVASSVPARPPIPERRVALVIGNTGYQAVAPLANPRRDAEALARALRGAGFQVVQAAFDLGRDGLAQALQGFAAEADKADWAMVYFAGHGVEVGGVNYLVPTDARMKADRDVALEALALDHVLTAVAGARKLRLVVLDACRDNPFAAKMTRSLAGRSLGRGLASIEPEGGTLVAFAAKHGQIALDGQQDGNSPFVAALVKHLQSPGVEISKVFRLVRDDVLAATGNRQEPFTYGSLPGQDFFFRLQ
jgi:tetratricopeptide (TPR) repeat protein